jgi:ankyrin repeat protein
MCHSKTGNFVDVETLLVNGIDSRICDSHGNDALHYAQQEGNQKIVQLLLNWQVWKKKSNNKR